MSKDKIGLIPNGVGPILSVVNLSELAIKAVSKKCGFIFGSDIRGTFGTLPAVKGYSSVIFKVSFGREMVITDVEYTSR